MTPVSKRDYRRPVALVALLFALHAVLAMAVLGVNPLKHQTLTPFDLLVKQRAWQWVDPDVTYKSSQRADILDAALPQWMDARAQIRDGHVPLWNPHVAGGVPHLTPNYSTLTPGFVVFVASPDPARGFLLATLFNLAMAGLGMHLFLRRRLGWLAAVTGAATFEFCGFFAAWLYWPHTFTLMWAPWLLLAIDRCAQRPSMSRALGIAAASALLILGGFPFVAEVVFGTGALYAILLAVLETTGRRTPFVLHYAAGTLLGFMLCVFPLLEFLSWMQQFDLGYRQGSGSALDLHHVSRLMSPWAYQHKKVEQTMYVGLAMLALAVAAVPLLLRRRATPPVIGLFACLLLLITGGLVFDLWPMWLVRWVPGMAFNSWSRAIGVMDLALIVLGAVAIDRLWTYSVQRRSRAIPALLILVALCQVGEMAWFFRRFNGAVDAKYFYPDVPAIAYLQRHAGPFDSVVTDRAFLMSGTLGAYGLDEWFGHQFRTEGLRAALNGMSDRALTTRTASRLRTGDIQRESPLMASLNVRYLALSSRDAKARSALGDATPRGPDKALPAMPAHRYEQSFDVGADALRLDGISIKLATYFRSDLAGNVRVELRRDGMAAPIASSDVDAATVIDNALVEFYFPRTVVLVPGTYSFSLRYRPEGGSPKLTAWSLGPTRPDLGLTVDGAPNNGMLEYSLHRAQPPDAQFRQVFTAAGVTVLENRNSPNGPYFIQSLDDVPDARASAPVVLDYQHPDTFTMRYTGTAPGYVVVPMKTSRGWHVSRDGHAVEPAAKDALMPAVRVTGPAIITFAYRPGWLGWIVPWAVALVLLLGGWFLVERRRSTRAETS